jgi:cytochrome c oxidase subunit 2
MARAPKVRTAKAAALTAVAFLLTSCVNNAPQDALKPKGSVARELNNLFWPVFWIAVGVFCLVAGLILVAMIKFRERSEDEAPKQVHGNTRLELTWTLIPFLLLAGIAIPTVKTVFDINRTPKGAMVITATGHRWWWQFTYADHHVSTANELHIPTGQKIEINLTSVDVIHNFWPPELTGKLYAIPGRTNRLVIEADQAATYYGQCAEYCGTSHANMRFRVIAQTPSDFDTWLAQQQQGPAALDPSQTAALSGQQLFTQKGCAGCHTVQGVSAGIVGPDLTHLQSRSVFAGSIFTMNENNLRAWLRNPPGEKPGSVMPNLHLTDDEITRLIAYLETLK